MLIDRNQKHQLKKDVKRRMWTLLLSVPFGIGFAVLYYWLGFGIGLQIFLTVVCWGAIYLIIEIIAWLIIRQIKKHNLKKPAKRDPFAD